MGAMRATQTGNPALPELRDAGNVRRIVRPGFVPRWQNRLRAIGNRRRGQRLQHLKPLRFRQPGDPAKPCLECRRVHVAPLPEA